MVEYHQEQSMQDQWIQYFVHIIDNIYVPLIHQIHLLDLLKLYNRHLSFIKKRDRVRVINRRVNCNTTIKLA